MFGTLQYIFIQRRQGKFANKPTTKTQKTFAGVSTLVDVAAWAQIHNTVS